MPILDPVVIGAHATAFATPLHSVAHLADAATAFDESTLLGVLHQYVLKLPVLLVTQQRHHLACERGRFDERHQDILYAIGGYATHHLTHRYCAAGMAAIGSHGTHNAMEDATNASRALLRQVQLLTLDDTFCQQRTRARLQLSQCQARHHLPHRHATRRDFQHRQIGIDAAHASQPG